MPCPQVAPGNNESIESDEDWAAPSQHARAGAGGGTSDGARGSRRQRGQPGEDRGSGPGGSREDGQHHEDPPATRRGPPGGSYEERLQRQRRAEARRAIRDHKQRKDPAAEGEGAGEPTTRAATIRFSQGGGRVIERNSTEMTRLLQNGRVYSSLLMDSDEEEPEKKAYCRECRCSICSHCI